MLCGFADFAEVQSILCISVEEYVLINLDLL